MRPADLSRRIAVWQPARMAPEHAGSQRAPLLDGKVAIVAGVGPGLGQANARALAREGAQVVLAARTEANLDQTRAGIEAAGGTALCVPTNIADRVSADALVARTVEAFGRLDVLVNNAFRSSGFVPFETADLQRWRKIYDLNVWGTLNVTQAAIPHLKQAAEHYGDASIVFILSMSMRKIRENEGDYSGSKAALHTTMQGLALELGPSGVRVNAVAPGWIGGPNVELYLGMLAAERGVDIEVVRAERESEIPLREIPPQDDIANSVVFLASPWSRVITGQTLDVNGGEYFG
jgi:NAD(P)-dependent dehydrogenase (short-subunit alcohol dehydrogenase family)